MRLETHKRYDEAYEADDEANEVDKRVPRQFQFPEDFRPLFKDGTIEPSSPEPTSEEEFHTLPPREEIKINHFAITSSLGTGSYASVFLCKYQPERSSKSNPFVAVKRIEKRGYSYDRYTAATFVLIQNERDAMIRARSSPFAVKILAAIEAAQYVYLVMEHAPVSLAALMQSRLVERQRLARRPRYFFDEIEVAFYAIELAAGIKDLHDLGIIHRDVKPGNILVSHSGHVKIADFGLARCELHGFNAYGTHRYMTPEMITIGLHGPEVDWWGLGITMVQMLTGQATRFVPGWALANTRSFLGQILDVDIRDRLGTGHHGGDQAVLDHSYFKGVDWDYVRSLKMTPVKTFDKTDFLEGLKTCPHRFKTDFRESKVKMSLFYYVSQDWKRYFQQ